MQPPDPPPITQPRRLPLAQVPEGCPFCHEAAVAPGVLAETAQFVLVCDRAPLVPGHLLIIPRVHLACYGALPRALYPEFRALKTRVAEFLSEAFAPPVFFEHGLVAQTVPHAHLHAVPAYGPDPLLEQVRAGRSSLRARGLGTLHRWYGRQGAYLFYESGDQAYVLAPEAAPGGYLKTAFAQAAGIQPPPPTEIADVTRDVRDRWQHFEQTHGRASTRVVTCFLEQDGAVCLLKRSEHVGSARGKWHAVSGFLPEGKDPLLHAYDELAEETGLTRGHLQLRRWAGPLLFADRNGGRPWEVHAYLFTTAMRALTLNWEHVEYTWINPAALPRYDCVPWLADLYAAVAASSPPSLQGRGQGG
jgi:diadenosine tetraphosphate (Ap4A) HIT family hydrolase/ADP-ribose pyrophosphatase YjhB (NUDIX family)